MKIVKYLCVILVGLMCSCSTKESDIEYKKVLDFFEGSVVSHFPNDIPYKHSLSYDTIGYFNTYSVDLTIDLSEEKEKEIIKKYKIFNIDDPCVVVVNDFLDVDNIIDPSTFLGKSKFSLECSNFNVIPNFWNNNSYYDKKSKSKLNENFRYIIVDTKKGLFNDKIIDSISFMPDGYGHGYSKGYAIDQLKNKIIYWSIIW